MHKTLYDGPNGDDHQPWSKDFLKCFGNTQAFWYARGGEELKVCVPHWEKIRRALHTKYDIYAGHEGSIKKAGKDLEETRNHVGVAGRLGDKTGKWDACMKSITHIESHAREQCENLVEDELSEAYKAIRDLFMGKRDEKKHKEQPPVQVDIEDFKNPIQDVQGRINGLRQWKEAEGKVLYYIKQATDEFRAVEGSSSTPNQDTQQRARERSQKLSKWLRKTDRHSLTEVRNDHLVTCYDKALGGWFKTGGKAVVTPLHYLENIEKAQEHIYSAYHSSSASIEKFEFDLGEITEKLETLDKRLEVLRAAILAEKVEIKRKMKEHEQEIRNAFKTPSPP